jgi:hypothetical protein
MPVGKVVAISILRLLLLLLLSLLRITQKEANKAAERGGEIKRLTDILLAKQLASKGGVVRR